MSLDSNNRPIKKYVEEYFPSGRSSIFGSRSETINVVLTLKGDDSGEYNKFLKVTIDTCVARKVGLAIQNEGMCLLMNERLGNHYCIVGITYIDSNQDNYSSSVEFKNGALHFKDYCFTVTCEYTQCECDVYNSKGELVGSDVLMNTTLKDKCLYKGYRLIMVNDDGTSDIIDSVINKSGYYPCTDYDKTPVLLGELRDNLIVRIKVNTGDECEVIMERSDYDFMVATLKEQAIFISKQVLYIVDCEVVKETNKKSTCFYLDGKLNLISVYFDYRSSSYYNCGDMEIYKHLSYDLLLDDGSVMNICCENNLDRTTYKKFAYGATLRGIEDIYYRGKCAFIENIVSTNSDTIVAKHRNISIDVLTSDSKHFNCCVTLPDYTKLVNSQDIHYFLKDLDGEVSDIKPSKVCYNEGNVNCVVNNEGLVTSLLILNE